MVLVRPGNAGEGKGPLVFGALRKKGRRGALVLDLETPSSSGSFEEALRSGQGTCDALSPGQMLHVS
jgi:hypothetical protein